MITNYEKHKVRWVEKYPMITLAKYETYLTLTTKESYDLLWWEKKIKYYAQNNLAGKRYCYVFEQGKQLKKWHCHILTEVNKKTWQWVQKWREIGNMEVRKIENIEDQLRKLIYLNKTVNWKNWHYDINTKNDLGLFKPQAMKVEEFKEALEEIVEYEKQVIAESEKQINSLQETELYAKQMEIEQIIYTNSVTELEKKN